MISLKLVADLLWLPVELIIRCFSVPFKKNLYRVTFFFTDPSSILDHLRLYLYKRNCTYLCKLKLSVDSLKLGHRVATDTYFWSRAFRMATLYDLSQDISAQELSSVSDQCVKVLAKNGKYIILNGNGRVQTLSCLGFQHKLEVEVYVSTIKNNSRGKSHE